MKKICITYDTQIQENGQWVKGETCTFVEVSEERLGECFNTDGRGIIEVLLQTIEYFKSRKYIWGSIKTVEEVSE